VTASLVSQSYQLVPLDFLREHPDNPREGDTGAIHASIETTGFYGTIVVQRSTGRVLAGNHRLKAARAAGLTELPAMVLDVDDDTARRILLVDNRTNDLASYDEHALAGLLLSLDDLVGTGFSPEDLQALQARLDGPLSFDDDKGEPDKAPPGLHVLITCRNAAHQAELLDRFTEEGFTVKALTR
jgi:ParB-like chromosome segregation protein Spo0J